MLGLEDGELRLSAIDLLANDSTPNPVPRGESGDYWNGLRIVSVGNPVNGQVGIENGQVVFIPDENGFGTNHKSCKTAGQLLSRLTGRAMHQTSGCDRRIHGRFNCYKPCTPRSRSLRVLHSKNFYFTKDSK